MGSNTLPLSKVAIVAPQRFKECPKLHEPAYKVAVVLRAIEIKMAFVTRSKLSLHQRFVPRQSGCRDKMGSC